LAIFITHAWFSIHKGLLTTFGIAYIKSVLVEIGYIWLIKMLVDINLRSSNAWEPAVVHCRWQILPRAYICPRYFFRQIIWHFELDLIGATKVLQKILLVF
jgi:hypothetical protein